MYLDQITGALGRSDLVARDSLATFQWEAALDAAGCFESRDAWADPGLTTASRWLAERFAAVNEARPASRRRDLVTRGQAEALWRRVIEESAAGRELIGSASAARWCAVGRQSLLECEIEPAKLASSAWPGDAEMFLHWWRRFDSVLDECRWVDPDSLLYRLGRSPPERARDVLLLDPERETPAWRRLGQRWREAGLRASRVIPRVNGAELAAIRAKDPVDEAALAARWCAELLDRAPAARLAVVVPDLARRQAEILTRFEECLGAERVWVEHGPSIRDIGPFGAALSALELLSPRGGFTALGRWLRSPFFTAGDDAARALTLETRLRRDARAAEVFLTAYGRRGLRHELREALPAETAKLDSALDRVPNRASPTHWVGTWLACLKDLDWKGSTCGVEPAAAAAWDAALAAFAELTPVVGELDCLEALSELEAVMAAQTVYRSPILTGVHLLDRVGRVGPGYAGAWCMGFTDQAWPEAPEINPLVPWSVRVAHAMPGALPEATLAAAREELASLRARVAVLMFSCPTRIQDEPQTPSPEIDGWDQAPDAMRRATIGHAAGRIGSRALERGPDPAPPQRGRRIRGGARTLDLQSACPVRAFCETRLGARELERPAQGITPRLRGLLVHRALELLLEPAEPDPYRKRLARCIDTSFLELTQGGSPAWNIGLELERERVRRIVERFLELETERPPFLTIDLERRVEIALAGRTLSCRIDRIDRLDSGAELLIDYKTGKRAPTGWFDDRITDSQLPLYAQQAPETTGAVAAVLLDDQKIEYRAAGSRAGELPGRHRCFEAGAWTEQIARWRAGLTCLVEEYVRGDARLRLRNAELADGAYAPLTRVKRYLS